MKKYYLTSEEVAAFFAELYNLRQAEIAEKEALQIMAEGENNKAIVHFLSVLIAAPNLLAGLEQFSAFIPEYILVLLRNTDKKAVEIEILADIAAHLDRLTATDNGIPYKQQLRSYLSYPIAVLVVAFIIANILLIFVMPVFSDFFRGFGAELPALTLLMVNLSDYMQANIWLLLMLVVLPLTLYFKSSYSAGIKCELRAK